jgi:hypothetical protein
MTTITDIESILIDKYHPLCPEAIGTSGWSDGDLRMVIYGEVNCGMEGGILHLAGQPADFQGFSPGTGAPSSNRVAVWRAADKDQAASAGPPSPPPHSFAITNVGKSARNWKCQGRRARKLMVSHSCKHVGGQARPAARPVAPLALAPPALSPPRAIEPYRRFITRGRLRSPCTRRRGRIAATGEARPEEGVP